MRGPLYFKVERHIIDIYIYIHVTGGKQDPKRSDCVFKVPHVIRHILAHFIISGFMLSPAQLLSLALLLPSLTFPWADPDNFYSHSLFNKVLPTSVIFCSRPMKLIYIRRK